MNGPRRISLRRRLILNTILPTGVLLSAALLGLFLYNRHLYSESKQERFAGEVELAAANINNYFETKGALLQLMADSMTPLLNRPKKLKTFFNLQKRRLKVFNVIYGLKNGKYISSGKWVPPKTYDPRKRPWYTLAVKNKNRGPVVTEAYQTPTKKILLTTIAMPVYTKGKNGDVFEGVAGFDIRLRDLNPALAELAKLEDIADYSIVGPRGDYIIHKERDRILNGNINETAYHSVFAGALDSIAVSKVSEVGDFFIGSARIPFVDWYVFFRLATDSVDRAMLVSTVTNIIITIAVILLVTFLVGGTGRRLTDRIERLAGATQGVRNDHSDFSHDATNDDEIGDLSRDFASMVSEIRDNRENIVEAVTNITKIQSELANVVTRLKADNDKQGNAILTSNSSNQQLNASIKKLADHVQRQDSLSKATIPSIEKLLNFILVIEQSTREVNAEVTAGVETAEAGQKLLDDFETDMNRMAGLSDEIGGIVNVIKSIANQIALLALNASIEAARAGQTGRGFAVVADQISGLSEETAEQSKRIGGMIESAQPLIKRVIGQLRTVGETYNNTYHKLQNILDISNRNLATAQSNQAPAKEGQDNLQLIMQLARKNAEAVNEQMKATGLISEQMYALTYIQSDTDELIHTIDRVTKSLDEGIGVLTKTV